MVPLPGRRLLLSAALLLSGCMSPPQATSKSPLAPARMTPQSVVLQLFFVRFPVGDPRAGQTLWQEIDEQQLAPDARRWLVRNGFRAGVVAGHIPAALADLLQIDDEPPPVDPANEPQAIDLECAPLVVRRHLQVRPGRRSEIVASGVVEEMPVLVCEGGAVGGEIYREAQSVFAAKASPDPDGRVRIELTPELHHGAPKQRWATSPGMLRLEAGRAKRVFDEARLEATLSPGHMLVITSLPDRPGSLGHHFFSEDCSGSVEQKLLVVRLAQTQHDVLFDPAAVLALDK